MNDRATLVVYGGATCCLCPAAKDTAQQAADNAGIAMRYINIDGDSELEATYRESIPIGILNDRVVFKYMVEPADLIRRLQRYMVATA